MACHGEGDDVVVCEVVRKLLKSGRAPLERRVPACRMGPNRLEVRRVHLPMAQVPFALLHLGNVCVPGVEFSEGLKQRDLCRGHAVLESMEEKVPLGLGLASACLSVGKGARAGTI